MVRHYEKTGILAPGRERNGYRVFTEADVQTVIDARLLIAAGLSAAETAELICIVCSERGVPRAELHAAMQRLDRRREIIEDKIGKLVLARDRLDELRDYVAATASRATDE